MLGWIVFFLRSLSYEFVGSSHNCLSVLDLFVGESTPVVHLLFPLPLFLVTAFLCLLPPLNILPSRKTNINIYLNCVQWRMNELFVTHFPH